MRRCRWRRFGGSGRIAINMILNGIVVRLLYVWRWMSCCATMTVARDVRHFAIYAWAISFFDRDEGGSN